MLKTLWLYIGPVIVVIIVPNYNYSNGGMKSGGMSIPAPTSCTESKTIRMHNEAVLYPCATDNIQDSRVMWATLTPRGTTRHYLEEHTYETIGNGSTHKRAYSSGPIEHVKLWAI